MDRIRTPSSLRSGTQPGRIQLEPNQISRLKQLRAAVRHGVLDKRHSTLVATHQPKEELVKIVFHRCRTRHRQLELNLQDSVGLSSTIRMTFELISLKQSLHAETRSKKHFPGLFRTRHRNCLPVVHTREQRWPARSRFPGRIRCRAIVRKPEIFAVGIQGQFQCHCP